MILGNCRVILEIAGPGSDIVTQINILPDSVRIAAGAVLDECVDDDPNHLGGYVTTNFGPVRAYATEPSTNLTAPWRKLFFITPTSSSFMFRTDMSCLAHYWNPPLAFFTVTIDRGVGPSQAPGDYDEIPPKIIGRDFGDKQRQTKNPSLKKHYADGVKQYLGYAVQARLSGYSNKWWKRDQNWMGADNMAYECDADLGIPNPKDCSQIEYYRLGAPSDKFTVGPGSPKVLSSSMMNGQRTLFTLRLSSIGDCNVAITSATLIVITWAQVKAALDELIDLCGATPLQGSLGGKAYNGDMGTSRLGIRGRVVSGELFGVCPAYG